MYVQIYLVFQFVQLPHLHNSISNPLILEVSEFRRKMSATETIVESGGAARVRLSQQSPAATLVGGLPLGEDLPPPVTRDAEVAHAPNRNHGLSASEKKVLYTIE